MAGGTGRGIPGPVGAKGSLVALAGLLLGALLFAAPARVAAQRAAEAAGRVVRLTGADTISVTGAKVMLHKVARAVQGPVDSVTAGPRSKRWCHT